MTALSLILLHPSMPYRQITNSSCEVDLFRQFETVWKPAIPSSAGSANLHVVKVPFRFTLPSVLPASGVYGKNPFTATVHYFVKVVGIRSGFHKNKEILCRFAVVPSNIAGFELSRSFKAGWTGKWKTVVEQKRMRQFFFGEYASASVIVSRNPFITILTNTGGC